MKNSKVLVAWLITALWTVAGASLASISDALSWTVVWITVIGIPGWLSWGYWPRHDDQEWLETLGAVAFVVVNTAVFLVLMLVIGLACSSNERIN